ncbi:MAG: NAD-dependent succinate-semialdehyde dehydrogenase [Rhodospirillales bacterium]|jgi:succinate-semialdehyde dehydrogenase/glutarate-semialdehyde dehydrogenase|nr:NAD-dependent succinate-semialdehyde dehydrogenase [Rhodospirillales bacterium]
MMNLNLRDAKLFRQQCYIDGAWTGSTTGRSFEVNNPADGSILGTVPELTAEETGNAINAAEAAFREWSRKPAKERASVLRAWLDLIREHTEDLATLLTVEQGKPLAESTGEIGMGCGMLEWFLEEGKRIYGDTIPTPANDRRIVVIKQPIGVVAAITPWNFPHGMIMRKCSPALAAGCTVVIKPASMTPYSALALAELADRAGIPKGVINVITGAASEVGGELTSNATVRKLSFTGSTEIGKVLMRQCADTVKKMSLELGGNAPFLVFDDADLDQAVDGLIASKFRNSGQTCVCANRVFAQDSVYDDFLSRFAQAASALKVGPGLDRENNQGPLINADGVEKVERLVEDAVKSGARIVIGGKRHERGGTFYEPTLLADVTMDMDVAREEIFGPVAPVIRFKDEEEAIRLANDTEYGLAAYFYARDMGRVWRVAEGLESGVVGINVGVSASEVAPFGGWKESGIGREGSKYGIDEFVEIKYLCVGGVDR